jgi:uncharacterized membrane protein
MTFDPYDPRGTDLDDAPPSIVTTANVVYALHTLAVAIGVAGTATVVGSFLFGIPSIVAVVINYVRRPEAFGTFVESHFRWQIRTFWFAAAWAAGLVCLALTIVGIPLALAGFVGLNIWVIYRVARGWLRLRERRPMYVWE